MSSPELAEAALDMFCRNVSYTIEESTLYDIIELEPILQVEPSKVRQSTVIT